MRQRITSLCSAAMARLRALVQYRFPILSTLASGISGASERSIMAKARSRRMTGQLASLLRSSLDEEPGRLIALRDELAAV